MLPNDLTLPSCRTKETETAIKPAPLITRVIRMANTATQKWYHQKQRHSSMNNHKVTILRRTPSDRPFQSYDQRRKEMYLINTATGVSSRHVQNLFFKKATFWNVMNIHVFGIFGPLRNTFK